jgi:hypothetical protein
LLVVIVVVVVSVIVIVVAVIIVVWDHTEIQKGKFVESEKTTFRDVVFKINKCWLTVPHSIEGCEQEGKEGESVESSASCCCIWRHDNNKIFLFHNKLAVFSRQKEKKYHIQKRSEIQVIEWKLIVLLLCDVGKFL